jgi:serine/threonine-protein kinase
MASLLRRIGRLPADKAVMITHEICAGLAAIHDRDVLHRDLKPANVMITRTGLVKVLDFGLARRPPSVGPGTESVGATLSVPLATAEHAIVGTPAYMSPEQAAGRPADARSDVFSFGVTLYEMIAGQRPFAGDTDLALLFAIQNSTPKPLRDVRPDVDARLRRSWPDVSQRIPARVTPPGSSCSRTSKLALRPIGCPRGRGVYALRRGSRCSRCWWRRSPCSVCGRGAAESRSDGHGARRCLRSSA